MHVVEDSSSFKLGRVVLINESYFIAVVDVVVGVVAVSDEDDVADNEGLFKPSDECFKCAFGFKTTRTLDDVDEVLICSKANCGNGKRIDLI